MARRTTTRKRAATRSTQTEPLDTESLARDGQSEQTTQDDLDSRVEEYQAQAGDSRCYQRDPDAIHRQCLLRAAHPAEDDDGNPQGHVFEKDDGERYELL